MAEMPYKPKTVRLPTLARVIVVLPLDKRFSWISGPMSDPYDVAALRVRGNTVAAEIRRHVDLEHGEQIEVVVDAEDVCVYCKCDPEPDANGVPQCCTTAEDDAEAAGLVPTWREADAAEAPDAR